jgi:hypothetical protein
VVRRHQHLAVHPRLDHALHDAIGRDMDQEGAEFLADHEAAIGQRLDALQVEIRARQIARLGAFIGDAEGNAAQRIAQEGGLQHLDLAGLPVGAHLVEHQ